MYRYIEDTSSTPWEKYFEKYFGSIFEFSHLLIRGLIKGLSPNLTIFCMFSIEIYYYIVYNGSKS